MARHRTAQEKVQLGEQARAMRAQGRSRREIQAALGIGDDLAKALLRGTRVPEGLRRARAKDDHRAAAVALRQQGRTYDEIAAELGVSKGSLSLWLSAMPHPTEPQRAGVHAEEPAAPAQLSLLPAGADPDRVEKARQMRLEGFLLREIAAEFGVSVKTVCLWCTGLPVPPRARHGGDREHVRMMSRKRWEPFLAERERERQAVKRTAAARVGSLSDRELELIAVTAYWCEGSKDKTYERRECVIFINSDPTVIAVWLEWLRRRGYACDRLRLNLSIHESADIARATEYWADVAGVDPGQLGKPALKRHNPRTVRKNVGDAYVGCLVVRVLQGRTLYQEIEGIWRGITTGAFPQPGVVAS
jgi:DNA-directed RNA polymerase specialized sigma24 family protein